MSKDIKYDPNGLLDEVMRRHSIKNDAALSRFLHVAPPVVSKIRHNKLMVGAVMTINLMDRAGLTLPEVRSFVGGAA